MKYGYDETIHKTEFLYVETDLDGVVRSVWFRCAMIPFEQVKVGPNRAQDMYAAYKTYGHTRLVGVELLRPDETPSNQYDEKKFEALLKKNGELENTISNMEVENSRLKADLERMAGAFSEFQSLANRYQS
jgi:hypothetical protein